MVLLLLTSGCAKHNQTSAEVQQGEEYNNITQEVLEQQVQKNKVLETNNDELVMANEKLEQSMAELQEYCNELEKRNVKLRQQKRVLEVAIEESAIEEVKTEESVEDESLNPIDAFFEGIISAPTIDMAIYESLYLKYWEDEFNNVISVLLDLGHENIKEDIIEYQKGLKDFAYSEADIVVAFEYSSAFQKEYHDEEYIVYGTLSRADRFNKIIKVYREATIKFINYLPSYNYIFDSSNLTSEDKELINRVRIDD